MRLKPIHHQVIVITGATSGIGLVTARMAADRGARLALCARNEDALRELVDELTDTGAEALYVAGDVADPDTHRRLARAALDRFGRIDTWVNNAAVSVYGELAEIPLEEHRRVFETNYWGYVHGSLEAAEHLHNGALICIGSVLSDRSIPMQGPYCASKHAVKGFVESLRMELHRAERPISVTLIKPSAIDTPYKDHAKNYFDVAPKNPPPVYAPDAVARTVLFCAEHPRREIVVGAGGKAVSFLGLRHGGLTDLIMGTTMSYLQRTNRPPKPRNRHSLFEPRGKVLQERGHYPHFVHETSLYTQARLRPWTSLAVAGAATVAAGALWMTLAANRQHGREQPSLRERAASLKGGYGVLIREGSGSGKE